MTLQPRTRRLLKWSTLAAALLLLITWAVSTRVRVAWHEAFNYSCAFGEGCLHVVIDTSWWWDQLPPPRSPIPTGWYTHVTNEVTIQWGPESNTKFNIKSFSIPLWMLFVPLSALSVALWRFDSRATQREATHRCPACTYPRTGLTPTSPCPECGTTPKPITSPT